MTTPVTPTAQEILDEELGDPVQRKTTDDWRHGVSVAEVYHRSGDGTYWQFFYRLAKDGEYNGLEEEDFTVRQVFPHQVTVTRYFPHEVTK